MPRPHRHLLAVTAAALLLLGAAACGEGDVATVDPPAGAAETGPGIRVVSPTEAAALLEADPPPAVVDVRTPEEFAQGHLEGATLIDVTGPDFAELVAELDREQAYVLYCRSGNRSVAARQVMADLGFVDVADIEGGISAWVAEGLPVVSS